MSTELVNAVNVSKVYNKKRVLNNVSIKLNEGEILGLLGANAAGKSTLASILIGLIKPNSGSIKIFGLDLKRNYNKIKKQVNIVPQEPSFYFSFTVEQNMKFFGKLNGLKGKLLNDRVSFLIEWLGLSSFKDKKARFLSGGYKRLLNIAISLLNSPKLLFLDEPTVGLDPSIRSLFWEKIKQLRDSGTSICITTHYMDEAQHLCDKVALMVKGNVLMQGSPQSLINLFGGEKIAVLKLDKEVSLDLVAGVRQLIPNFDVRSAGNYLIISFAQFKFLEKLAIITHLIRGKGFNIISSQIKEPDLEDVFIHLIGSDLGD